MIIYGDDAPKKVEEYEPIFTCGMKTPVAWQHIRTGRLIKIDKKGMKLLEENMNVVKRLFLE